MGIRRGTTTGGYANAGHAYTAGPSSITFSFFFTLSASFSYSHWCPHRAGHGKNKAVCSHRASPRSPRWIQHPASALKPQRKQATCTHAVWTFSYSCNSSLCIFWVSLSLFWLSFLYAHRYYTWHLFMAWQNCCSNSPAPLALVVPPPWLQHALFGQTNTKKTICKKQVYALCDFDRYWWSKPHSHPLRTVVYVGCEFNKRSASIRGHVTSPPDPTLRWQAWKPNVRQGVTLEVMRGQVTLGLRRAVAKRLLTKCWVFRY